MNVLSVIDFLSYFMDLIRHGSHEYLLVLYPAFLNKKIRKDNYPKRSQKIIGTLAQTSFRDTKELKDIIVKVWEKRNT